MSRAWMRAPWTCPACGETMMGAGKGPHRSMRCGKNPAEQFWAKADKGPHPKGCWVFNGCRDKWGYAQHGLHPSRRVQAHRYAYELAYGPIPAGKLVMHTCDNPPCVRPGHLLIGTDAENMLDKALKGRANATIKPEQVLEVRKLLAEGKMRQTDIAAQFGVKDSVICKIKYGAIFAWLK